MTEPDEKTPAQQILDLVAQAGVLRPRDLDAHGIPREQLRRLHERGLVQRVGRGLYMLPDADVTEHHALAEACKRVPQGVVCLLSALQFHGLTTQAPFEVWLAVERKARLPRVDYPPLRFARYSAPALAAGVEQHHIDGVLVKVYSPAKTVADCFKYRNKIGRDVAIEALNDCLRQSQCTVDELWRYAQVCRVTNVIKPYLEALL
ncbi:MAG: AbiEi antitoxin N-terminal domain-containing protein [Chloroflexi bacterium]|nr:AbiEi antitoxin N-terminal domain-containing protein [Chloroflexota bacterium]